MAPEFRNNTGPFSLPNPRDEAAFPAVTNAFGNHIHGVDMDQFYAYYDYSISLVLVVIDFCGSVGNGLVIWLLGFRMKRKPFSVYILNLACADFTFLLSSSVRFMLHLLDYMHETTKLVDATILFSFLVSVSLLMVLSTERCVSVLCPIWYRCHRPAHLSSILCALVWGLTLCVGLWRVLCDLFQNTSCRVVCNLVADGLSFITFLVLFVSGVTLLIRVQCGSRRRQTTRLYVTILLNVLAFLLLGLPYSVWEIMSIALISSPHDHILQPTFYLLSVVSSVVNPIIYFFVGRHGQPRGWKPLRQVLQRALTDEEEGTEWSSRVTVFRQNQMSN
ncbi:mas-related G-protein coupled receptor member X4-like [Erinaceus europaeus]|uniref:Mas-related G-protein coupled receptor member X4-like n=1 Tax=Erinaceus europaeus TaxID=9365 RepID=A0ABM3WW32_ERIEU|nr:mas-related G-protein coupled receptor member X4-like [Erinaceus europaeus]